MTYVQFIEEERCYGGPEEGGWNYTRKRRVHTIAVKRLRNLEKATEQMLRHIQERSDEGLCDDLMLFELWEKKPKLDVRYGTGWNRGVRYSIIISKKVSIFDSGHKHYE